jgi:hypothetical protein
MHELLSQREDGFNITNLALLSEIWPNAEGIHAATDFRVVDELVEGAADGGVEAVEAGERAEGQGDDDAEVEAADGDAPEADAMDESAAEEEDAAGGAGKRGRRSGEHTDSTAKGARAKLKPTSKWTPPTDETLEGLPISGRSTESQGFCFKEAVQAYIDGMPPKTAFFDDHVHKQWQKALTYKNVSSEASVFNPLYTELRNQKDDHGLPLGPIALDKRHAGSIFKQMSDHIAVINPAAWLAPAIESEQGLEKLFANPDWRTSNSRTRKYYKDMAHTGTAPFDYSKPAVAKRRAAAARLVKTAQAAQAAKKAAEKAAQVTEKAAEKERPKKKDADEKERQKEVAAQTLSAKRAADKTAAAAKQAESEAKGREKLKPPSGTVNAAATVLASLTSGKSGGKQRASGGLPPPAPSSRTPSLGRVTPSPPPLTGRAPPRSRENSAGAHSISTSEPRTPAPSTGRGGNKGASAKRKPPTKEEIRLANENQALQRQLAEAKQQLSSVAAMDVDLDEQPGADEEGAARAQPRPRTSSDDVVAVNKQSTVKVVPKGTLKPLGKRSFAQKMVDSITAKMAAALDSKIQAAVAAAIPAAAAAGQQTPPLQATPPPLNGQGGVNQQGQSQQGQSPQAGGVVSPAQHQTAPAAAAGAAPGSQAMQLFPPPQFPGTATVSSASQGGYGGGNIGALMPHGSAVQTMMAYAQLMTGPISVAAAAQSSAAAAHSTLHTAHTTTMNLLSLLGQQQQFAPQNNFMLPAGMSFAQLGNLFGGGQGFSNQQ